MARDKKRGGVRFTQASLAATLAFPGVALAVKDWNLQPPVTPIARQMFDLHSYIFWICVVIFIAVFGVMFYSIFKHRKSVGHKARAVPREHDGRDRLDGDPVPHPAVHGVPRDQDDSRDEGHVARPDMTIKVTGYQWKWSYDYLQDGFGFYSNLSTPLAQIENRAPKGEHYLLEVDKPLVVPVDTKVRVLITASDVIHAWWVPAFGVKQDAIPGFVRDSWFRAEKVGTYRGQCAELCGKEHGFMPIVVEVKSKDDYAQWAADAEEGSRRGRRRSEQGLGPRTSSRVARRSTRPTAPPATRPTARACPAHSRRSTARRSSPVPKADQIHIVLNGEADGKPRRCRRGSSSPTPTSRR